MKYLYCVIICVVFRRLFQALNQENYSSVASHVCMAFIPLTDMDSI